MRRRLMKLVLVLTLMTALTLPALATEYSFRPESERLSLQYRGPVSSTAMATDAAIARPAGFVATVTGATLWTLMLPFTIGREDRVQKTGNNLVRRPAAWTFKRPLGIMEPPYQERPLR